MGSSHPACRAAGSGKQGRPLLVTIRTRQGWGCLASLFVVDDRFLLKHEGSLLVYIVFPIEQPYAGSETIDFHVLAVGVVLITTVFVSEISGPGYSDIAHVYPRRSGE